MGAFDWAVSNLTVQSILDECIAMWRVIGWWRQWHDKLYNDTLSLGLPYESRVSISSTVSVTRHTLQRICCLCSCCARECVDSHSLCESIARVHVCRPFDWLSLVFSWHLLEACFCNWRSRSRPHAKLCSVLYKRSSESGVPLFSGLDGAALSSTSSLSF